MSGQRVHNRFGADLARFLVALEIVNLEWVGVGGINFHAASVSSVAEQQYRERHRFLYIIKFN